LFSGTQYPWRLFAAFGPEKTVFDIVEALLSAVWIDCGGDWDVVTQVARRIGLLTWLERALEEDVGCWHPKEEVGSFGLGGEDGGVRYVVFRGKEREAGGEVAGKDVTMEEAGDENVNEKVTIEVAGVDDSEDDSSATMQNAGIGQGTWHCRIVVNGESICTASGWNRLEVETAAAEQAIVILQARKSAAVARGLQADQVMLNEDDVQVNVEKSTRAEPNYTDDQAEQVETPKRAIRGSPTKRKRCGSDAVVDQVITEMGKSRAGCLRS